MIIAAAFPAAASKGKAKFFFSLLYSTTILLDCVVVREKRTLWLNKMAENWGIVLMQGGTTDRKFDSIIEQDYGLEIDKFFTFLLKTVFSLFEYDVFSV